MHAEPVQVRAIKRVESTVEGVRNRIRFYNPDRRVIFAKKFVHCKRDSVREVRVSAGRL